MPIGYAVRGGALAEDLRRYKSDRAAAAEAAAAAARLRELLAAFLADHGHSVWAAARMAAGPTAVAVVPSGQGRLGAHPLVDLVRSCVALPLVRLAIAPEEIHTRGVNPRLGARRRFGWWRGRPGSRRHLGFRWQRPVGGRRAQAGRRAPSRCRCPGATREPGRPEVAAFLEGVTAAAAQPAEDRSKTSRCCPLVPGFFVMVARQWP